MHSTISAALMASNHSNIQKKKTDRQKMLVIKISSIDYIIETDLYREPTEQLLFAFTNKTPILL